MAALGLGAAPATTLLVAFALLVFATGFVVEVSPRRYLHYSFTYISFATFLVVGPATGWLVGGAALIGTLIRAAALRLMRRPRPNTLARRPESVLVSGAAVIAGLLAGHLANRAFGGRYPIPLVAPSTPTGIVVVSLVTYSVFNALKEVLNAASRRGLAPEPPRSLVGGGLPIFAVGIVMGIPLQLFGHALYAPGSIVPWALALGCSILTNKVVGQEVNRMRENRILLEQLAVKERLAAIGEVTARIVHQTRHQIGIIGMIAHEIERHVVALPQADARAVQAELRKLAEVHGDLRRMLVTDLRDPATTPTPESANARSYADLLRAQAARLAPLARERKIKTSLRMDDLPARDAVPLDPEKFAHACFNVLQNALAAASSEVSIALYRDDELIVVAVLDDGPGMDDAILARATEPFVTTKSDGSGMGLAIARAAVEEAGGAIELENREQGGLAVRFRMPSSPAEAERHLRRSIP